MGKKIVYLLSLSLLLSVFTGCTNKNEESKVSDSARVVIETMMTCPNQDLFHFDMLSFLGEDVESVDEETKNIELYESAYKNWESIIGEYFGYGYLKKFLDEGSAYKYLINAELNGEVVSVKEMILVEKTDASETVGVTYLVNSDEQQVEVKIYYDLEGKIKEVTII